MTRSWWLKIATCLLLACISYSFLHVPSRLLVKPRISPSFVLMAQKYKVTIKHEGVEKTMEVRDDCSILEAALEEGIELPYDCKLGVCLTCPSKVVSGKVDQTEGTLEDSVIAQGYALTCVSKPRSDCVIHSIPEDELVSAQFQREP